MNSKNNREKQINDIVSIVKVSSLLFIGIILFKMINDDSEKINELTSRLSYLMTAVTIPVSIVILSYCFWIFSDKSKFRQKYGKILEKIEISFIMMIYTFIIYISGAYESEYKFLYLFLIITTTIQSGMKEGIAVSLSSSLVILIMDLMMVSENVVNKYFENDLILAGVFILTAWPLGFYVKIEGEHIKQLEKLANQDGLTGLYNHRYFFEVLDKEISKAVKNKESVGMIFIDLDYFKNYNDLYGHQKGDYLLKALGDLVSKNIEQNHIACRYGGEEFAIIMPEADEKSVRKTAENLRRIIEETKFEGEENQPNGKVTASIGVSIFPEKAIDATELIKNADDALYRAKFLNKNRVEVYSSVVDDILNELSEEDAEIVSSVKTLIGIINAKDKYTYGHIERVVMYSSMLADKLKLNLEERNILLYGAYMHDIGKIDIPEEILIKKAILSEEEHKLLMTHPTKGVEILKSVEKLKDVLPLIEGHHEWYDGTGYPNRLKGEEIPYLARILAIINSFDAMTNNRPYGIKKTYEETIEEIRNSRGTQFDPEITDVFLEFITKDEKNKFFEIINGRK